MVMSARYIYCLVLAATAATTAAATVVAGTPTTTCPPLNLLQGVRLAGHIVGFAQECPSIEECCDLMPRIHGATSFTYNSNATHTPPDPDCRFFGPLAPKTSWTNCSSCVSFAANNTTSSITTTATTTPTTLASSIGICPGIPEPTSCTAISSCHWCSFGTHSFCTSINSKCPIAPHVRKYF